MDLKKSLLEKFVVDNEDLEHLESLLYQFNIFEAVGMVRQEIRHSNFLAFLLNPTAAHHLSDIFLKTFLKRLLISTDNATVSAIEVDVANLTDTEVRREWKNIDILLVSSKSRLVCAIENKVDSSEHSNQLQRYRQIVQKEFPGHRHIFVYLTPSGMLPYDDDDRQYWSTYSYDQIADLIDDLSWRDRPTSNSEVTTLMKHYSTLIRRHLMEDSEIARLCHQIYLQHKDALDLIYEHRPTPETKVYELVKKLVKSTPAKQIVLDNSWAKKKILSFAVPSWDKFPAQKTCQDWTESRRILLLQFKVEVPILKLVLTIGPGDLKIRQSVYQALKDHNIVGFTEKQPSPELKWVTLLERIVSDDIGTEMVISDVDNKAQHFWQKFLADELPQINEAIVQALGPFQ